MMLCSHQQRVRVHAALARHLSNAVGATGGTYKEAARLELLAQVVTRFCVQLTA